MSFVDPNLQALIPPVNFRNERKTVTGRRLTGAGRTHGWREPSGMGKNELKVGFNQGPRYFSTAKHAEPAFHRPLLVPALRSRIERRDALAKDACRPDFHTMNRPPALSFRAAGRPVLAAALVLFATLPLMAQPVQHLVTTRPGGMPGLPVMQGIEPLTNGVRLAWDGPAGYYQVQQKSNSLAAPWVALGKATNLVRFAVVTQLPSNAFFRVSGPLPKYAGMKVCLSCHLNVCRYVTNTPHASAFSNPLFKALA
jgi:hypothetical protein